jgi:hypothetical protein
MTAFCQRMASLCHTLLIAQSYIYEEFIPTGGTDIKVALLSLQYRLCNMPLFARRFQ